MSMALAVAMEWAIAMDWVMAMEWNRQRIDASHPTPRQREAWH
jgi:hypothetical protein